MTIDHKLNFISELNVISAIQWKSKIVLASTGNNGTMVSAPLPTGTTAWYINAYADQLTLTSDHQEIK